MPAYTETTSDRRRGFRYVPAYGPVDAGLGFWLFYVLVDRATPTVVRVAADVTPTIAASSVRFGLAAVLWLVLALSALDQLSRQLAALGVTTHNAVDPDPATRTPPSESVALAYLVVLIVAGGVAWLTFDRGIDAAISLFPALVALDVGALRGVDVVFVVVFFLSFAATTRSLDRLLVGGVRWLLADWK